ncbi:FAD/NAD(P)-binding domain-containing protein [Aspergillus costaricaensis CBS 115574]|uniref:FAD/NAD(P)-binding domain-containing protein n=1 Tax=Aspergillus costaricaensis CBS 115574 TaxID=1448317 RepID=A0ACD1IIY7_9EURO|nr:FAD/NAD(P)-binding domain-containing protein [Aspergillus costaricaensis CBS 115574]RAK89719.1 FAD/NAD(P)-binding domain-containing protein [Aspergillus costaricaensis CBS 115574]
MEHSERSFRAIIVGSGITGLSMAHALECAGIDYIVLEKNNQAVPHAGAAFILWPHITRILDQFGCLDKFREVSQPLRCENRRGPNGKLIVQTKLSSYLERRKGFSFGYPTLSLDRRAVLDVLYTTLPNQSRVMTGKRVASMQHTQDGVEVVLTDGSREKGDIIIGADGVYSTCREYLWNHANTRSLGTITITEKKAFRMSYKCLVGVSSPLPDLKPYEPHVCHNKGFTILAYPLCDKICWGVSIRTDQEYPWPTKVRYNSQDIDTTAASLMSSAVTETLLFGELWHARIQATLVPLQEGIMEHWSSGRIVLVGDSAHKMTPDAGLGGGCGIEDAIVLTNLLKDEMEKKGVVQLDETQIENCFLAYEDQRKDRVKILLKLSGRCTRQRSSGSLVQLLIGQLLLPLRQKFMWQAMSEIVAAGPSLTVSPCNGARSGRSSNRSLGYMGTRQSKKERTNALNLLLAVPVLLVFTLIFMLSYYY